MAYKKKIPMRKCLGCNEVKPKKELIRIVRSPDGTVSIDPKGKVSGRGCYICPTIQCFDKATKDKKIDKALETKISDDLITMLRENVADGE